MKKYAALFLFSLAVFTVGCFNEKPGPAANLRIPKDTAQTKTTAVDSLSTTILLTGDPSGSVFYYEGEFKNTATVITKLSADTTNGIRAYLRQNNPAGRTFRVKWGGAAKYSDVIDIIDELKTYKVEKYTLTKIAPAELNALLQKQ